MQYSLGHDYLSLNQLIFMKRLLIVHFITLAFVFASTAQSFCDNAKVVSPLVPKPMAGSIVSASCSNLVVEWQGTANQSYTANVSFYNTATNKWDTAYAAGTCNSSQMCTATLPVTAETKVSWSVQAQQVIEGRTFYSYYLIGDRDYLIPSCTQQFVTKAEGSNNKVAQNNAKEPPSSTDRLEVFPNPATNEINIKWSSAYKGTAVVAVSDAAGKEIRMLRINKEGTVYNNSIPVSNLVPGLYYVQVKPQRSGKLLTEKFLKQ
jgi:hypothetical protein